MYKIKINRKKHTIKVQHVTRRVIIRGKSKRGLPGVGIPTGGTAGQILAKKSNSNYDTEWKDEAAAIITSVNGKTGDVVINKTDVGLGNVDNTSDVNKPISAATQAALDSKVNEDDLALVATTGDYDDLINKPVIPDVPVSSVNGQVGDVVLDAIDVGADPAGSAATAEANANAYTDAQIDNIDVDVSNKVSKSGDYMTGELELVSTYPSDDISGGTDGTNRLNLQSRQRANFNSFGETIRHFLIRKDAKAMEAYYVPKLGYDGDRNAIADFNPDGTVADITQWQPVSWTGSHFEANDHNSNHVHWELEIPDSTGALQGRLEVPFADPTTGEIGLDKTFIRTNLADFVVRTSNNQMLRLSSPAGNHKPIEFNHDSEGLSEFRRWQLRANGTTESGSNAGTDFQLVRYDDSGNFQDSPLFVQRSTGYVGLGTIATPARLSLPASIVEAGGINFGGDTNLYRSASNTLRTDDSLVVGGASMLFDDPSSSATVTLDYSSGVPRIFSGGTSNMHIGDSGGYLDFAPAAASGSAKFTYNRTSPTSGSLFRVTSAGMTGSSASETARQYGLKIDPTINQSSGAHSSMLLIDPTVTALGSGTHYLIDARVGGTQRFTVDHTGNIGIGNLTISSVAGGGKIEGSAGGAFNVTDQVYTGNQSVSGNISITGTVDGRDVSVDGTRLDTITDADYKNSNTTKSDVGLSNVDNTSDADKPISTLQQAALDTKLQLGGDIGGTVSAPLVKSRIFVTIARSGTADYICDGVADDVQIQAAIDYVASLGGGTIFIRAGMYRIASTINIPFDARVRITGEKFAKTNENNAGTTLKTAASVTLDHMFSMVGKGVDSYIPGTGTVSKNGTTTLTGSGTSFSTRIASGDTIIVDGETRTVDTVTNNTSLTVTSAFTGTASGLAYEVAGNPLVNADLSHDISFENMSINGNLTTTNNFYLENVDFARFEMCRIISATNSITTVWNSTVDPTAATIPGGIFMDKCIVSANSGIGIDLDQQTQCWITNSWFTGTSVDTWIRMHASNKLHISNNEFNTATQALLFSDSATASTQDVTVNDCVFAGGKAWTDTRTHASSNRVSIVGFTQATGVNDTLVGNANIVVGTSGFRLPSGTFTGDINVPDEAYGVGWNGSTEVPTKNALYDKIESIISSGDGGVVDTIVAGDGISVDSTDPANPIVSATSNENLSIAYAIALG